MSDQPTIAVTDAADMCAELYDSRAQALRVARRLRGAGYRVVENTCPRADGATIAASVYYPGTGESPGDIAYRT
jgi:hypothetical protein